MSAISACCSSFLSAIKSAPSECAARIKQVPIIAAQNLYLTFDSVDTFCDRHIQHFEGFPEQTTAQKIKAFASRIFLATPLQIIGSLARSISISSEFYLLRKFWQDKGDPELQRDINTKINEFIQTFRLSAPTPKPNLIYKTRELIEYLEIYITRLTTFDFTYDTVLLSLKILLNDLQKPGIQRDSYNWYDQMMSRKASFDELAKKLQWQSKDFGRTPLTGTNYRAINSFHLFRIGERSSTVLVQIDLTVHLILDRLMKHPLFKKLSKAKQEQYQRYREEVSKELEAKVLDTRVFDQFNHSLRVYYDTNYFIFSHDNSTFQDLL